MDEPDANIDLDFINYQCQSVKYMILQYADLLKRANVSETIEPILANTMQTMQDIAEIRKTELRLSDSSQDMLSVIAMFFISNLMSFTMLAMAMMLYLLNQLHREGATYSHGQYSHQRRRVRAARARAATPRAIRV